VLATSFERIFAICKTAQPGDMQMEQLATRLTSYATIPNHTNTKC